MTTPPNGSELDPGLRQAGEGQLLSPLPLAETAVMANSLRGKAERIKIDYLLLAASMANAAVTEDPLVKKIVADGLKGEVVDSPEAGLYLKLVDEAQTDAVFAPLLIWKQGNLAEPDLGTKSLVEIDASSRIQQRQEGKNPEKTALVVKSGSYSEENGFTGRMFAIETDGTIFVKDIDTPGFTRESKPWVEGTDEVEGKALWDYLAEIQGKITRRHNMLNAALSN